MRNYYDRDLIFGWAAALAPGRGPSICMVFSHSPDLLFMHHHHLSPILLLDASVVQTPFVVGIDLSLPLLQVGPKILFPGSLHRGFLPTSQSTACHPSRNSLRAIL